MTNEELIKSISLEGEEWRDVTGWEGLYAVSNIGRVVSYGRIQRISNGRGKAHEIHFPKKIMSLCEHHNHHKKGDNSYFSVMFRNNGKNRRFLVHRIVATEFIPNPLGYKHIDHIDANKHNNRVENLRWCNPIINMGNPLTKEAISRGAKGRIAHNRRKILSFKNTSLVKEYESLASVKSDGFSPSNVYLCCVGRQVIHKGYKWMYADEYATS